MRSLVVLLGVPIDNLDFDETLDEIERLVKEGRATGRHHQVVTVNADFVVKMTNDPELRYLLQDADLATADGMPLVWGARLLGVSFKERVTGADMLPALAQRAAEKGFSVYFFGAAPGVAQKAADLLKARYPGLIVAGVASPPVKSVLEMDAAALADIRAAKPDILFVALGNPKQEKWIGMYGAQLGVPVMMGVGAALDFVAGQVKRAPVWMQKSGLEWVYRLAQEPRRLWRRYVVDMFVFSWAFARQWWLMRKGIAAPINLPSSDVVLVDHHAVIHVRGRLVVNETGAFVEAGRQALEKTAHILVDLSGAEFLDSAAIGALVDLAKRARQAGGEVALVAMPANIRNTLKVLHLDTFFRTAENINAALKADHADLGHTQEPPALVGRMANSRWTVLKAPRRFDAGTAQPFQEACIAQLAQNPFVVLDLSETDILASAGLAAIMKIHQMALEKKGQLRLVNCSKDVLQTIHLVRLDRVLSLYTDIPGAMVS